MRIGILTIAGAEGQEGGAERFFQGLCRAFVEHGFDAQQVSVPVDERSFTAIEEGYLRCYDLDVARFDAVVSTKAPTYLVRHPNHVCYLVHTIRVFYDMFPEAFPAPTSMQLAQRSLVHRLDTLALRPPRTHRVFAIGHEVACRLRAVNGIDATVLHPPLPSDQFRAGAFGDYILLPGRLHRWKRVDLVIAAMRSVRAPLRLIIAGAGEDDGRLRALAASDTRIAFAGRVSDAELVGLYAGALAVAFVPLREDYGYVTVEAFRSGKPVVTCVDSGEAARLVEHERSGLVVDPNPVAVGAAFERLWGDRDLAGRLGQAGAARERVIRWGHVVPAIAEAFQTRSGMQARLQA
jgi:glycosyltransferase involved in cell wall biosynthesis